MVALALVFFAVRREKKVLPNSPRPRMSDAPEEYLREALAYHEAGHAVAAWAQQT